MCLLSYQLVNKQNQQILALDANHLFKDVTKKKIPFFQWNNWLSKTIDRLNLEYMYKKKNEFEYAKYLQKKFDVKESHF